MTTPPGDTSRSFVPGDLERILRFLAAVRAPEARTDYPGPADLREMLALPEVTASTRLWFDVAGEMAAFAVVDGYANLWFDTAGAGSSHALQDTLLEWAIDLRRRQAAGQAGAALDTNCRLEDQHRVAWLEARGFRRQPWSTLRYVRDLRLPIPPPRLPAGYSLRSARGDADVDALVALHREAFATDHLTREERLSWMSIPEYEAELDLIVVAPDGTLAGSCICGVDAEENALTGLLRGHADPLAVRPAFGGRGLGRALLLQGMRLLADRGMAECVLSTRSDNTRMRRLAEATGFCPGVEKAWFSLDLPTQELPGADPGGSASRM